MRLRNSMRIQVKPEYLGEVGLKTIAVDVLQKLLNLQVEAEQESQYIDEELGEWAEDMEVLKVRRKEGSGSKDLLMASQRPGPEVEQESEAWRKKPKWDLSLGLSPGGGGCVLPSLSMDSQVSDGSSGATSQLGLVGSPAMQYLESESVDPLVKGTGNISGKQLPDGGV
ncbi:hypothetical protein AB205_0142570 [Aquarana catesbeiana]|uniref:Uncharacterized protein n=1 Tax=Aquarana catesbeiana TaxID=8400 RepID=A0A2G9Q5R1_AQUCT|nr:hypothetical protein AB205_0142570 [Aquarana catesbeiana]